MATVLEEVVALEVEIIVPVEVVQEVLAAIEVLEVVQEALAAIEVLEAVQDLLGHDLAVVEAAEEDSNIFQFTQTKKIINEKVFNFHSPIPMSNR